MDNKLVQNRRSPKNEEEYRAAYLRQNPSARKHDGMDIAAVKDKNGNKGHALLPESINRGHDDGFHRGKDFIPDNQLLKK